MEQDLLNDVRLHIYRRFVETSQPPTVQETADVLELTAVEATQAYRRLADGHVIVLEPGSHDIWMANPLSARETSFRVESHGRSYWGTCAWDAPGVLAMLGAEGTISTSCPDCKAPLELRVRDREMEAAEALAHFAVPAAHWWDDIGYT
ncbi:MAG: organomercurial lyase [Actinomycetota bacterium]